MAVLGAGSWGTALALQLAKNGHIVHLWEFDTKLADSLIDERQNAHFLPGFAFPDNIFVFKNLAAAIAEITTILIAVPSHAFHSVLKMIKDNTDVDVAIAWATKGLSADNKLLSELVFHEFGDIPMAILSGPTFAKEVALGLPTAITIAANRQQFAILLANYFHGHGFRAYVSDDLVGVQIGGAAKNILAIAVGIADGMGCGANTRAALIARGLAEISRFGEALGGKRETFMGLSGLGDLVLTCTDNQSRNRRFGLALGAGKSHHEALAEIGQVIEGITACKAIYNLAKDIKIEMPIIEQVYKILYQHLSPINAAESLLNRALKAE